jgi:hypothetical protein
MYEKRTIANYHNTVPEEGDRLHGYAEKAKKQDDVVLNVFKWNMGRGFTPAEVHVVLEGWGEKILLTSVRRSISNLTKARKLVKCQRDQTKIGLYKRSNRTWKYNSEYLPNIAGK